MPLTVASPRSTPAHTQRRRAHTVPAQPERVQVREAAAMSTGEILASYVRRDGRERQVVARRGAEGSVLVVDRDAITLGDRRLVAHLAPDEPAENADIVCAHYIADLEGHWCRRVSSEDLREVPVHGAAATIAVAGDAGSVVGESDVRRELSDARGDTYRLEDRPNRALRVGAALVQEVRVARCSGGREPS